MALAAEIETQGFSTIEILGQSLTCDLSGCVYWAEEKTLIVSDLHLEKGSSFARRGKLIPPYDTGATLKMLKRQIEYWQPERVISLGDSFHDDGAAERLPKLYLNQLVALVGNQSWVWISGNHDPSPPAGLGGDCFEEVTLGPLTFRHEPEPKSSPRSLGEIAGHLHPVGKIKRRTKTVRRRCFVEDGQRMIMPSFGAFTGGLNVKDDPFKDLFVGQNFQAHLIGKDRLYSIAGNNLVR